MLLWCYSVLLGFGSFFLSKFITNIFDKFFDKFFDEFFRRTFLTNFSDELFRRIFPTNFSDELFWRIFLMIFLWTNFDFFRKFFLTYNLLTIASFRIGVPLILFSECNQRYSVLFLRETNRNNSGMIYIPKVCTLKNNTNLN